MATELKHPADEIARALSRANGILTVIGGCFDKQSGQFAIGTSYLAESITAVDSLLNAATAALARLYQTCDLSVIREISEVQTQGFASEEAGVNVQPAPIVEEVVPAADATSQYSRPAAQAAAAAKTGYLAAFGPTEATASLVERAESIVPVFKVAQHSKREALLEQPALTYDELLAKVTAVADQAAFQAHSSPTERSLLPALEGLRADLLKMRSVA